MAILKYDSGLKYDNVDQYYDSNLALLTANLSPAFITDNTVVNTITITGTGFQATPNQFGAGYNQIPTVYIGKYSCDVTYISSTELRATVPINFPAGTYDVTITNVDGKKDVLVAGVTIQDLDAVSQRENLAPPDPSGIGNVIYVEERLSLSGAAPTIGTNTTTITINHEQATDDKHPGAAIGVNCRVYRASDMSEVLTNTGLRVFARVVSVGVDNLATIEFIADERPEDIVINVTAVSDIGAMATVYCVPTNIRVGDTITLSPGKAKEETRVIDSIAGDRIIVLNVANVHTPADWFVRKPNSYNWEAGIAGEMAGGDGGMLGGPGDIIISYPIFSAYKAQTRL